MSRDPVIPTISVLNEGDSINITIPSTQAQLEDQGYIYNQAGFTYNQPGVFYGGVYNTNQDVIPLLSNIVLEEVGIELSFSDIYRLPPIPNFYHSIGPGFFMFVTIP